MIICRHHHGVALSYALASVSLFGLAGVLSVSSGATGAPSMSSNAISMAAVATPRWAPANDDVCNAQALTVGVSTQFDNTGATMQPGEPSPGAGTVGTAGSSCLSQDGWCSSDVIVQSSIWFTYVAPSTDLVLIHAGPCDLQLAVWEVGDCTDFGTFVEVAANDDSGPGSEPRIRFPMTPGQTYYVQLDGRFDATCSGTILVEGVDIPHNNLCADAQTMAIGETVAGSTAFATFDGVGFCGTGNSAPGVWYHLVGDGCDVRVTTSNPGTNYDTKLTVFSGSCAGLVCVGGNDDGPGIGLRSRVDFSTDAGRDYLILVHGFGSAVGNYELSAFEFGEANGYDCDCNGLDDGCEIANDPSLDLDNSGFLDSCEDCPDVDCDGIVTYVDLGQVILNFGQTGVNKADVNFDGVVNFIDYLIVATHQFQFCGGGGGGGGGGGWFWWWW